MLEGGGDEGGGRAALAETADAVDAAGGADRGRDGLHAPLEAAVRARGFVLAEPGPAVAFLFVLVLSVFPGPGHVPRDVGGPEAVGRRGEDEGRVQVEGGGREGLGEELGEGFGLGGEEGAGLGVAV